MLKGVPMQTSIIHEQNNELVDIPVEMISVDVYPRDIIDVNRIGYLKTLLEHGTEIDPIKVVEYNNGYSCIDGVHRFEARKAHKESTIQCVLLDIKKDPAYFLLHAAAYNNNTSKPLSKSEIKSVIIESFEKEIPVNEIIDILDMKKTFVYSILSPLLKKRKTALKKKAIYLHFVEGKKVSIVHEILGTPKPTLIRWFNEAEDANLFDQDIFDQIKSTFGDEFTVEEKQTFFCLQQMARGTSILDISENLNVKPKWIVSVGTVFLQVLKSDGNIENLQEMYSNEAQGVFSMVVFLTSYFKKLLPEKRIILSWLNDHREYIQNHGDLALINYEIITNHKESHSSHDQPGNFQEGAGSCVQSISFSDVDHPGVTNTTHRHPTPLQINFQELDRTVEALVDLQDHIVLENHVIDHKTAQIILETFNRIQIIMNMLMPKLADLISLHR